MQSVIGARLKIGINLLRRISKRNFLAKFLKANFSKISRGRISN
nr:hypothetical protein [uncultured Campylobacter sp.]